MYLPNGREAKIAVKRIQKTSSILVNIIGFVLIKTRKIQIVFRKRRHAANTRRKAIRKTRVLERLTHEHLYAVTLSPIKRRIC